MPSDLDLAVMLRHDILAQLRSASRPLSTRTLRMRAAPVPVAGTTVRRPPLDPQIYRSLARLRAAGLVTSITTGGRSVLWQLTPKGAAGDEIAELEALLAATAHNCPRPLRPTPHPGLPGEPPS